MLIINVKYTCKSGSRDAFLNAIKENKVGELSRAEKGNVKYEYSCSVLDENVVILNELWESPDFIPAHRDTEHFKKLTAFKDEFVEKAEITRFLGEPFSY